MRGDYVTGSFLKQCVSGAIFVCIGIILHCYLKFLLDTSKRKIVPLHAGWTYCSDHILGATVVWQNANTWQYTRLGKFRWMFTSSKPQTSTDLSTINTIHTSRPVQALYSCDPLFSSLACSSLVTLVMREVNKCGIYWYGKHVLSTKIHFLASAVK